MLEVKRSAKLRVSAIAGGALALGLSLSGCSLFSDGGPDRDPQGTVTATSTSDAFQIKVGDCIQDPGVESITDVVSVPCSEAHDFEAYDRTLLTGTDYPGEDAVEEKAEAYCGPAFTKFVGIESAESKYTATYFYPTDKSWKNDDREILCLVYAKDKGKITGSIKGLKK